MSVRKDPIGPTEVMELPPLVLARAWEIAAAARNLLKALDHTVPDWREKTIGVGENGDEVNEAWDALVQAAEGSPR
jgi:hypothetical protein